MSSDMHATLWVFLILVTLAGFSGAVIFIGGLGRLFHARFASGFGSMLGGVVLMLCFGLVASVALNLRTYFRLTYEQPVATLSFAALGPQSFRATLTDAGGGIHTAELRGDDWELSARVLKWKGFASVIGLDPLYRLDRLGGRYQNLGQERNDYHSVVDLGAGAGGIDLWSLAGGHAAWLPWVDAGYGSATYLPMADGAQYTVSLSPTGLLARPANAAAEAAATHW